MLQLLIGPMAKAAANAAIVLAATAAFWEWGQRPTDCEHSALLLALACNLFGLMQQPLRLGQPKIDLPR